MLIYSRSNGLTIAFSFQHEASTGHAISSSDPYRLSIMGENKRFGLGRPTASSNSTSCTTLLRNIVLRPLPYGFARLDPPAGLGQLYLESKTKFYQLGVLYQDLSLSEHLLADSIAQVSPEIPVPRSISQRKIYKTPTKVMEDFIVSDGDEDVGAEKSFITTCGDRSQGESYKPTSSSSDEDTLSISFKWLERRLSNMLAQFISTDIGEFDNTLQHLNATVKGEVHLEDVWMQTLYVQDPAPHAKVL